MAHVTELTAPGEAEGVIKEYALLEAQLVQVKEQMKPVREKLLAMFPKEPGTFLIKSGKWSCEVKFPTSVKWDADELTAHYGVDMPLYVKRNLSIDETDYKRLPLEEREALAAAREVRAGSPVIKVEVSK